MTDNLRHWDALCKTDPKHAKPFKRAGGFTGTAIKPIWSTKMMTEHFGPCGVGWGMDKPEFTTITVADEILVYCTVGLWYSENMPGKVAQVWGVGGDKVAVKRKDGRVDADDEAFKKSYTDAISNAMKQIGVGADVHMGQFEDSKYLREVAEEFAAKAGHANGSNGHNGNGVISSDQKDALVELIKTSGADTKRFLQYIGVPTVDEIPASRFETAKALLEKKGAVAK